MFIKAHKEKAKKEINYHGWYSEKYEHRQLAWVCEHECNVGEKYVLPQA